MSLGSCWRRFVLFLKNERNQDPVQYRKPVPIHHDVEFESLLAEENYEEVDSGRFVTEAEIHHIREGNWDKVIEEREKMNAEIDQRLSKEEEDMRREQEAYYAARSQAAKQKRLQLQGSQGSTSVTLHGGGSTAVATPQSTRTQPSKEVRHNGSFVREEDFGKFLKSMEVRTSNLSQKSGKSAFAVSDTSDKDGSSDGEDDLDFGFWEKASDEDDRTASGNTLGVLSASSSSSQSRTSNP